MRICRRTIAAGCLLLLVLACTDRKQSPDDPGNGEPAKTTLPEGFAMGADLSYVNQVEDHGGVFRDSGQVRDPFRILKSHGANWVRVRLWHNPLWVTNVYGDSQKTLYSGTDEVIRTVRRAKEQGMSVNLDFHYSDFWADPGRQEPPAAWENITSLAVLKDSVHRYTHAVLSRLKSLGLMPDMVQIGNEINCGMMMTGVKAGFPGLNGCNSQWKNLGEVINSAIRAVREVSAGHAVRPLVTLHVADPKNLEWWFSKAIADGGITDFDVIGFSYYPLWHTTVAFRDLPDLISRMKTTYNRKVMIVETGYPWTTAGADSYGNLFGSQPPLGSYPFTREGQLGFMKALTQAVITAGGSGIFYWEPAWITSGLKDSWGTGSSWENAAFFDFQGNALPVVQYLDFSYNL